METIRASVADVKKRFSEYVNRTAFADCRVVITKRQRPVAAIISLDDLQSLEQNEKREGLASVARSWKGFDELEKDIADAINQRHSEGEGRDVSF